MKTPKKILIVKLGSIGDVVHALPVLRTLRSNLPSAYIAWIVEEKPGCLLQGNPDLDELITINSRGWRKNRGIKTVGEIRACITSLRKRKFDLAIDLQGLIKSGVLAYLSGAKTVIGFSGPYRREWLNGVFTTLKSGPEKPGSHVIDICLSLLRPLRLDHIDKQSLFTIPDEAGDVIAGFFSRNGLTGKRPLIAVNPGAGWKTKEWGVKNWAALSDMILSHHDCDVIITWGPGEKGMADGISRLAHSPVTVAPPTSLPQSLALLKRCDLFIGADTGPLHIAAALGIQTVALFGPSDPARNGPYGTGHRIIHKRLECGNCYKRVCETAECMKLITVEDVYRHVRQTNCLQSQNA